jgi:hypothetical protein
MRFNGHSWKYNPHTIKILSEKEIVENKIPYSSNVIQNFGRMARVIKGEGCLYGSDCFSQFDALWKIFRENKSGVLSIPEFAVMNGEFYSLEITGEPTDKMISYSFTFIEVMDKDRESREKSPATIHNTLQGQSLWTIANIYNLDVEALLSLNPQIKHPFDIEEGDKVKLC